MACKYNEDNILKYPENKLQTIYNTKHYGMLKGCYFQGTGFTAYK